MATYKNLPGSTFACTGQLRWNKSPGKYRLEQKWVCTDTGKVEWHTVPLVEVGYDTDSSPSHEQRRSI